ncbi:hypothetical protein [Calidithermus terrae]|uniref:hypothetical protein n=1 Tax=Calidithermus terrae TaxID=1408545 RepID=UPI0011C437BE|nr:hypothetical protein [Calidithermus terrae]
MAKAAVGADGRFTLALPGGVAARAYATPDSALQLPEGCDFRPSVSPAGARALLAHLLVYAGGEATPRAFLSLRAYQPGGSPNTGTGASTLLVWADQPASVKGSGRCGEAEKYRILLEVKLEAGWNFVVIRVPQGPGAVVQVRADPKPEGDFLLYPLRP